MVQYSCLQPVAYNVVISPPPSCLIIVICSLELLLVCDLCRCSASRCFFYCLLRCQGEVTQCWREILYGSDTWLVPRVHLLVLSLQSLFPLLFCSGVQSLLGLDSGEVLASLLLAM